MTSVLGYLWKGVSWLVSDSNGQAFLIMVTGWLGWRKHREGKTVNTIIEIATEIFHFVEELAKKSPGIMTAENKLNTALGQLNYKLSSQGLKFSKANQKKAKTLWKHLGWAEKTRR